MLCLAPVISYADGHAAHRESVHRFSGNVNVLGSHHDGGESWLAGGLGRFQSGQNTEGSSGGIEGNLAYRYHINPEFRLSAHVQAQGSEPSNSSTNLGLIELELRYKADLDFNQQVKVTAGQFFLPISLENTERFWESPYTVSFSSLNSWIGEEFRPIGLDGAYTYHLDSGESLSAALTAFGGNDSMGALLAYRGWSYGRLRTSYADVIALPDLDILDDGGMFAGQRDDGTKPFGPDLDGRLGYAVRASFLSDRLALNLTWVDNLGDTRLHNGEYAWRTRFAVAGISWFLTPDLELISESTLGSSTMGAGPGVDIDFYSAYLMASYRIREYRLSYRYDQFGIDDVDSVDQENHDFGRSHTLALMWSPEDQALSAGVELLYLDSKRARTLADLSRHDDEESLNLSLLMQLSF